MSRTHSSSVLWYSQKSCQATSETKPMELHAPPPRPHTHTPLPWCAQKSRQATSKTKLMELERELDKLPPLSSDEPTTDELRKQLRAK
eukprot:156070-Chlamydomonas_euryale.AAC.1